MMKTWRLILVLSCLLTGFSTIAQQVKIRVACIGNSVTYGYGLKDPANESYPAKLQQLLGSKYSVNNFGHNGATLLRKGHNPYFKTTAFANAIAFHPDVVVIHLGLNDTDPRNWPNFSDEFESDYSWLIDTLKSINPSIKVYLCKLTPIFSEHKRFKSGTRDWYWQIQNLIPQVAKSNKTGLIGLNAILYNRPDLFADNLHPDKEGSSIIAKLVYQNVSKDFGGLNLAAVFTDNMVLQRNKLIPVYGTANAGELVTVSFNNHKKIIKADDAGNWKVYFPAMSHGGPYKLQIRSSIKNIELQNILIGDLWLCSGQSNMDFQLRNADTGPGELKMLSVNPLIRLYKLNNLAQTNNEAWDSITLYKVNQLEFFSGRWKECAVATAENFSAVAYYFGKKLALEEGVPIGLIQVSIGGAPTESFIDRNAMEQDNLLVDMLDNWRKSDFTMEWCRERAAVNLQNATKIKQRHPYEPCYNYESAIAPLAKFPIKGVIWYQGESNTHNIGLHEQLFKTLVSSWRRNWGDEIPFYYVQLSSIDRPSWPAFRNSQRKLQEEISNSGMIVSSDLGDSLDVHPLKKKTVGERLAMLALRYTYKKQIIANGPQVSAVKLAGNSIVVSFSFAKKLSTNSKPLTGFELVNEKGLHLKVDAKIVKNNVLITVPAGEKIKTVLYAWQPFTRANLVNEAGLPASTFSIAIR
ncbi:MAG: GDSL-type esterase/lipase family protein [Bacteroidota bacterium]